MQREQQNCKDCVHHKVCKYEDSFVEMLDRPTEGDMPACFSVIYYCDNYKSDVPNKSDSVTRTVING